MSIVSISVDNLSIGYSQKVVRKDISLSFFEGEMVCMLGPNGCGKSTFLRTLAGLQPALGGTTSLSSLSRHEMAKRLALVLTERVSLESVTIYDVVAMGRFPYTSFLGGLTKEDEQLITRSLESVDMAGRGETPFNALSDGEKQRVLVAKALAQQAPVILLDEPTAHLDLPSRIRLMQLLRELAHKERKTILVSTHELDLALHTADRILLMSEDGVELDTTDHFTECDAFTRAFGMDISSIFRIQL